MFITMIKPIILLISLTMFGITLSANADSGKNIASNKAIKLTEKERAFLDELGTLKVLVDNDFSPISYYDSDSQQFAGIFVDVLDALSKKLKFEYEIQLNQKLNWADKLNEIKKNEIHILGGASKNPERNKYGVFTELDYFKTNYAFIGSIYNHISIDDITDINKYKVGIVQGLTINNYILEKLISKNNVTYYKNKAAAFSALNRHEIDLFPYNEVVFKESFFKGERFDFEVIFSINDVKKYYAFFSPNTDEGKYLIEILNKGMQHININKVIDNRYHNKSVFAFYRKYSDDLIRNIYYKNIILVTAIILFIASIIILLLLKKQAKVKEHLILDLENALSEVKTLRGIIPICSYCHSIRDDEGSWDRVEIYIAKNPDAQFSHGVCPTCLPKIRADAGLDK